MSKVLETFRLTNEQVAFSTAAAVYCRLEAILENSVTGQGLLREAYRVAHDRTLPEDCVVDSLQETGLLHKGRLLNNTRLAIRGILEEREGVMCLADPLFTGPTVPIADGIVPQQLPLQSLGI